MSHYIEKVTVSLENLISELARNPSLFLKNPDTDFSRNRKINFKTCVGITMNSGGCTLNKELLDFFDFDVNAPTVSAYTQQRAKILPEAFEYLFHAFTEENVQTKNLYEGYQLLACDGSNLTIAPNLNDPETLWKSNQLGATGNHLHLNALYDVLNRTYIDALVQTASTYQEHRACIQMIERVTLDKVILIADKNMDFIGEEYIERDLTQGIGSTDVGNVTHEIPAIQFYVKLKEHVGTHTKEFAVAAGGEEGKRNLHASVQLLAMSALDVLSE